MLNTGYYSSDRKDLYPFIPSGIKRSLEVGCATGVFSENLKKERDIEVWGIEMVTDVANVAKTKLDKVLTGTFENVCHKLPDSYFDCVFFNDVLEHMPYPEECLKKIKDNISPGGCVIASVPNIRQIQVLIDLVWKKEWEYKESGIMDKTHLRFFTKKSIIRMFDRCGYRIDRIEGIHSVSRYCLTSILNMLAFNRMEDVKYTQFAIVASPK